jgi:formate/nitrite transporter FocA (FNT family)
MKLKDKMMKLLAIIFSILNFLKTLFQHLIKIYFSINYLFIRNSGISYTNNSKISINLEDIYKNIRTFTYVIMS